MSKSPLVSICIPTYNRAGMVDDAIKSALSQTYTNIEVLVVDNASQDNIESVIARYQDKRLLFFKNSKNLGMYGNFNKCIYLSHGEYIHILHSDDFIDSNFTQTCVDFMESHPEVMMTFGAAQVLTINGPERKISASDHNVIYPAPKGFKLILENDNPVVCPTVMMKRCVYESYGPYSCEYPYAGDFYQWLKISRNIDIAFVAKAILYYRQGDHTESFQLLQKTPLGYIDIIKVYMQIIEDLGNEVSSYRRELNISIRAHMRACINAGKGQSFRMKSFSPLIFIGFSLNLWTLIEPDSITSYKNKFFDFLHIFIIGIILLLYGIKAKIAKN
jgi:glycosyltransferase involved in cell wall biosynthesis